MPKGQLQPTTPTKKSASRRPNPALSLVPSGGSEKKLVNFMNRILDCRTIECVWGHFSEAMAALGFDRVLYISTYYRTFGALGDLDDTLILSTLPQAYLNDFLRSELIKVSPVYDLAEQGSGIKTWHQSDATNISGVVSSDERRLYDLNRKWGVQAGYLSGFTGFGSRERSVFCKIAKQELSHKQVDAIWEDSGQDILMVENLVHLKISTLPNTGQTRPLTKRQIETLEWVADGKIVMDIAEIMMLSENTVEKHLRLARDSLGVGTTAQAIQKATRLNLLFMETKH